MNDWRVDFRGGWPYFRPINCKRYGLRVRGLYESDDWLMKDGNPREWAVAYHSVPRPESICYNNKKVLELIMDGR